MKRSKLSRGPWSPRYWHTRAGLAVVWAVSRLPFSWQIRIGTLIGRLAYHLAGERRDICRVNIALCFPELTAAQQEQLVKDTFTSQGIGVMEVGMAWCRNPEDFRDRVTVSGLEKLQQAHAKGMGVLLLGAHFSTLEMGGSLISLFHGIDVTYRRHKNPVFESFMTRSRRKLHNATIERRDVRQAMRSLKQGHTLWYAADQDYGPRHSIYVDFFGVPAATITATARFARANNSPVFFYHHYRKPDNRGYHLDFIEVPAPYPTGNEVEDAKITNSVIEAAIRKYPEQYLWLHRRFKTQPGGKAARPYRKTS